MKVKKRIVYIIPGLGESYKTRRAYKTIARMFMARGISPIHVDIDWDRNSKILFKDYVEQFLKQYKKPKDTDVFILGFSFGAMTAFLSANRTKPKALILCSLSPYFKEDLVNLKPKWLKWWRDNSIKSDYSFSKVVRSIKAKTYIIVEDVDAKNIQIRAREAHRDIPNSSLYIAKGAKHNINQKEYLDTTERVINKL
ncbi:MAG: hypothetical protein WAV25_01835 [Minisyncoccia bacterium]